MYNKKIIHCMYILKYPELMFHQYIVCDTLLRCEFKIDKEAECAVRLQ